MGLHELKPARGSRQQRRRVGRGDAGRRGSYSGRGIKGQKAKRNLPPLFEGGQLPLVLRLPYMRGFTNNFRTEYVPINLDRIDAAKSLDDVNPTSLVESGIVNKQGSLSKILGDGEISRALTVSAHAVSKSARAKIEAAGGTITIIPLPGKPAVEESTAEEAVSEE